jgi:hypothetical protein
MAVLRAAGILTPTEMWGRMVVVVEREVPASQVILLLDRQEVRGAYLLDQAAPDMSISNSNRSFMSDLTAILLPAIKTIASHDLAQQIVPAIYNAVMKGMTNPAAIPTIGISLLAQVETGLISLTQDEITELAAWTAEEVQKYGVKLQSIAGQNVMPAPNFAAMGLASMGAAPNQSMMAPSVGTVGSIGGTMPGLMVNK